MKAPISWIDLRHILRGLWRTPGFTIITILTLALGVGATTAIFSVVNGVLLRPLPYPEPHEVMQIRQVSESGASMFNVSFPNYVDLREQSRSFEAMGAYADWTATISGNGAAVRVGAAEVTSSFFEVLGVAPALGRRFLAEESGGTGVAVVGHGYWQNKLDAERDLSKLILRLRGRAYRVIGVMPPGFSFPSGAQLWFPSEASKANQSRTAHNYHVIGRRKDGAALQQARGDLSAVARRLKERYGDDTAMADAAAVPLREELTRSARPTLLILFGAAGSLLLIACANVSNLLLARTEARRRELAVRVALGAGRGRLAAQLLTEVLALALAGGAFGVLLAFWGVPLLLSLDQGSLPRTDDVGVNWAVLIFALGLSTLTALAIGLVPALRAGGGEVQGSLADGQRTQSGEVSGERMRRVLTVSQVALTLVLLVGAALLAQSFLRVLAVEPGYRTDGTAVVMDLWLPYAEGVAAEERAGRFHKEVLDRVRAIPGVQEAGGVNSFPLRGGGANGTFVILDSMDEAASMQRIRTFDKLRQHPVLLERFMEKMKNPARTGSAEFRVASDGYFRAMGIPLVRGRLFDERDGPEAPHVALISRSLAETRWPGEDPIGNLIEFGNMDGDLRPFTIVGIVGDIRERNLEAEPQPTFYGYSRQRPANTFRFHVIMRGMSNPAATIASARAIVRELNPLVALDFRTLDQVFFSALSERRFTLVLLSVFGGTALLLAVLGIYGLISYLASQRVREVGIRMAVGARAGEVLRLFLRQGAALALAGVACGLVVAVVLTRLLAGLLYEVDAVDPATYAAVALLLTGIVLVASYVPARRASRVDPTDALRSE